MVSARVIFFRRFYFFLKFSLLYFGGVFDKAIIPLALVGYEMIVANSALCASLAIYHLIYRTCACGIIVNYPIPLVTFGSHCKSFPRVHHGFQIFQPRSRLFLIELSSDFTRNCSNIKDGQSYPLEFD